MSNPLTRWVLKIHKWIGMCLGVVVFAWLVSGIVMILPLRARGGARPPAARFDLATLSPAEALRLAANGEQDTPRVTRLSITPVLDRTYYFLEFQGGRNQLVDVQTGSTLVITPELAEEIARRLSGVTAAARIDTVTQHSMGYMSGPVPAYRVAFADEEGSTAYVSLKDGSARYTNQRLRIRFFVSGLHTFDQLKLLEKTSTLKKPLLHLTSSIGIGLILTGYYLVLPKRWRSKRRR